MHENYVWHQKAADAAPMTSVDSFDPKMFEWDIPQHPCTGGLQGCQRGQKIFVLKVLNAFACILKDIGQHLDQCFDITQGSMRWRLDLVMEA